MNLNHEFEKLFDEWKTKHDFNAFIKDGIVDYKRCEGTRVLFVLRDMNCQHERDLREDLRTDGSGWKTWANVGRWASALLDGLEDYPRDMSRFNRVDQLERIAAINLKKEGGVARAKGNQLLDAVETQGDLIFREICICDPEIIIACGLESSKLKDTASLLKQYVFKDTSEWVPFKSKDLDRNWWYYYADINGKQVPVVYFCHPQVSSIGGKRGHEKLFIPLYNDMLQIRQMFLDNQSTEKKLKAIIDHALQEKYGKEPPAEVIRRIKEEWQAIEESKIYFDIYNLYKRSLWLKQNNCKFYIRGTAGSSFILYLLGITRGNPMPDCYNIPWQMLFGYGGRRPVFMLEVVDVSEGSNELDEYEFEFFSEEYENITDFDDKIEHYGLSYSLSDKIGYREEIYFYLLDHGFLPKDAWRATESIRIGKGLPTITDIRNRTKNAS